MVTALQDALCRQYILFYKEENPGFSLSYNYETATAQNIPKETY